LFAADSDLSHNFAVTLRGTIPAAARFAGLSGAASLFPQEGLS
jgi:hypothetical protein